ncbi:MAG: lamin tail domain-containing protein [Pseudomonadota bacterium]|nr:lamin tail domain-containing protein [Pseudomonadota bacterium]
MTLFLLVACALSEPAADSATDAFAEDAEDGAYTTLPPSEATASEHRGAIYLNEAMPDVSDAGATGGDWLELWSAADVAVTMEGWTLAEHTNAGVGVLPTTTLEPGGRLLVRCAKGPIGDVDVPFRISRDGDEVRLYDADGALVDGLGWDTKILYPEAVARVPDGGEVVIVPYATPGAANE